jgi:hypothetical protein
VASVSDQRHGIGQEAVRGLDNHEAEVEHDADGESTAEIDRRMIVRMAMTVMIVRVSAAH